MPPKELRNLAKSATIACVENDNEEACRTALAGADQLNRHPDATMDDKGAASEYIINSGMEVMEIWDRRYGAYANGPARQHVLCAVNHSVDWLRGNEGQPNYLAGGWVRTKAEAIGFSLRSCPAR